MRAATAVLAMEKAQEREQIAVALLKRVYDTCGWMNHCESVPDQRQEAEALQAMIRVFVDIEAFLVGIGAMKAPEEESSDG